MMSLCQYMTLSYLIDNGIERHLCSYLVHGQAQPDLLVHLGMTCQHKDKTNHKTRIQLAKGTNVNSVY